METNQALEIIRNIINAGVQKGLFAGMDDVAAANIAFRSIEEALKGLKPANSNGMPSNSDSTGLIPDGNYNITK